MFRVKPVGMAVVIYMSEILKPWTEAVVHIGKLSCISARGQSQLRMVGVSGVMRARSEALTLDGLAW